MKHEVDHGDVDHVLTAGGKIFIVFAHPNRVLMEMKRQLIDRIMKLHRIIVIN